MRHLWKNKKVFLVEFLFEQVIENWCIFAIFILKCLFEKFGFNLMAFTTIQLDGFIGAGFIVP